MQADLAARAAENLADYPNVTIESGDGASFDPGECDAMLVNCGVTHPQTLWLDRLRDGGRLVLPFTMAMNSRVGQGVMTTIVRKGAQYTTKLVSPVAIFSGVSLRDSSLEPQLLKGLTTGGLLKMKSVRRDRHEAGDTCVVHTREVCLSLAETALHSTAN